MNMHTPTAAAPGLPLTLGAVIAEARPTGALWVPGARLLAVADLHLGKAQRMARHGGALLPPFETADTLTRLGAEIAALQPTTVVCVGDSFDDPHAAQSLRPDDAAALAALIAGQRWIWVSGNHDPAPPGLGGMAAAVCRVAGLCFRHIALPGATEIEVSGHYHPKATIVLRGRRVSRRCFLHDRQRMILPAFGTYTGGLDATDAVFDDLLAPSAHALLLGSRVTAAPRAALAAR